MFVLYKNKKTNLIIKKAAGLNDLVRTASNTVAGENDDLTRGLAIIAMMEVVKDDFLLWGDLLVSHLLTPHS